ncbi:MAG TPA: VWD domain-containing protein [Solirubrobacteraceae bacterium]|nr:VWD domain-containing protein [Solirubrobacteraceae bacterium]
MPRRGAWLGAVVGTSLLIASLAAAARAAPPGGLALTQSEVPGLAQAHASIGAARRVLIRLLGGRAARGASIAAVAFRRGRGASALTLTVQAFVLGSPAQAGRALAAWRRLTRGRRSATVLTAVQSGPAIAVLTLQVHASPTSARLLLGSYAALERSRLRTALSRTAWDLLIAGERADGSVSRTTLLRMFSLAYGRLPGVSLPAGSPRVPPISGSWFVQRVLVEQWPTLTRAQRRAVIRALWPADRRRVARASATVVDGCIAQVGGLTLDVAATDDARALHTAEQAHMPFATATFGICAYSVPSGGSTLANTISWYSSRATAPADGNQLYGSLPDECFVRLYDGWRALSVTNRRTILGHEMYHCLHGEWAMRLKFGGQFPGDNAQWVEDGLATWAGNEVAPGTFAPDSAPPGLYYKVWLDHYLQLPLFQQSYEPFGFWGLVAQEATSAAVWPRILDIWKAGADSSAVFDIGTGAQRALVLDHWGPGLFSQPGWPSGWQQQQPYVVANPVSVDAVAPVSGTVQVATKPYAALKVQIDNTAQRLVEVFVDGHGRLTDGSANQWDAPQGVWLCLGGGCACPPGQHASRPIPPHTDTGPLLYAGLAGDQHPTRLTLGGHDLSEYCTANAQGGGGGGGGGPPGGGSNGDPHLRTFDGQRYEFQALGEFVLARSTLGGFEVQARQQRIRNSFFSNFLSVNTQLAFRVGRARVTISTGEPLVVRVGGRRVHPERGPVTLPGGGSVTPASGADPCDELDLRWPDGSLACVWSVGDSGVAIWLYPASRLRGHLIGLLGNFDGVAADDFRTREGRLFTVDQIAPDQLPSQYNNRYHVFGESWRVRQRESLFDYGRGQSTATFTDRRFPKQLFGIDRLSAGVRARAEAVCRSRGISDPDVFQACVLDVAATGSDAFADSARTEEQASAISTPWQPLAGLQNEDLSPTSVAVTADGVLHIAVIGSAARNSGQPGNYLETTLDPQDRQGPVSVDEPATLLQYAPLLTAAGGLRLLGFTDTWPDGTPSGVSPRGLMSWQNGAVGDWLPGAHGPATSFAQTADGTPYTVTQAVNNFQLWRGVGASGVDHEPALGAFCFDHSDQVASDGQSVWLAWLEINCGDQSQNGLYLAPVSTTTGEIGAPQQVPLPPGASWADYDASEPLAFLSRPGSSGAWLAYALQLRGTLHGFLLHAGDTTATDLGPVTSPRLLAAATPSGALWVGSYDNNTPRATWLLHFRRFLAGSGVAAPGTWTVSLPSIATGAQAGPGSVAVAARGERLDLVATFDGSPTSGGMVWHTQIG